MFGDLSFSHILILLTRATPSSADRTLPSRPPLTVPSDSSTSG